MKNYWPARDARARLSELLRAVEKEPQIITYRGRPKVVVRAFEPKRTKKPKNLFEVLQSAPPGFADLELSPRATERPRKTLQDCERPKKTFAEWWKSAPRVRGFKLPPRV